MTSLRWRKFVNAFWTAMSGAGVVLAVVPLASLLWLVISQGAAGLSWSFFTNLPAPVGEPGGGVGNGIAGTFLLVAIASAIALPVGIGAGVFLAERGNGRAGGVVRFVTEVLSGVPSIVIGIVAYGLVVDRMKRFSALAGGLALALIMVPTLARSTEEFVRLVPGALREASLALGVPKWKTSLLVILRTAAGGIITAVLLAVARAAGETAPLLFTSLNNQYWNVASGPADRLAHGPDLQLRHQPLRGLARQGLDRGAGALPARGALEPARAGPLAQPDGGRPMTPAQEAATMTETARAHEPKGVPVAVPRPTPGAPSPRPPSGAREERPKLKVSNLRAWYGETLALKGVDLVVPPQSVMAAIGPSGCGKSTFLRCLNRMHELIPGARAEGTLLLDGEDLLSRQVDPVVLRRRVGMVFQRPNPFPTMSVRDNVAAGLKLNGLRGSHDEVVERTLKQAALWDEVKDRLDESALGLSGGQQQRLCIARALAVEPEVLLMDEPASALDPIATAKVEDLIHELKQQYTIVIVTHNMQQAARVSDQTAFFYMGELVEVGQTEKIFTNPDKQQTNDYVTGKFG